MKTHLLFLALLLSHAVAAQQWEVVGTKGFSYGEAFNQSIVMHGDIPYVAFIDRKNDSKATVMKFDGTNWLSVGEKAFTPEASNQISFAMLGETPYVAFDDKTQRGKISVMKYNGTEWVYAGSEGFIEKGSSFSLSTTNNSVYIAFEDWAKESKISVMKLQNETWEYVGPRGFSPGYTYNTVALAAEESSLYVAFRDYDANYKATVMKYEKDTWKVLAQPGFSDKTHDAYECLAVYKGVPHLASWDSNALPMVYQYNGSAWTKLGTPFVSEDQCNSQSICFAPNGTLYLAFTDWGNGKKVTVVNYDGEKWTQVGQTVSSSTASTVSIAVSSGGIPYVAYRDEGGSLRRTTVMRFAKTTGIATNTAESQFSVYPNPGKGLFTMEMPVEHSKSVDVMVISPAGQTIYSQKKAFSKKTILDLSGNPAGMYILRIKDDRAEFSKKLIINR